MKLSNIKKIGRFRNTETKQVVNIHQGRNAQRGTDHLFYWYRGKKQYISMHDFYSEPKKWEPHEPKYI